MPAFIGSSGKNDLFLCGAGVVQLYLPFYRLENLCLYGQCDKHQHQGTKELLHIIFTIFVI